MKTDLVSAEIYKKVPIMVIPDGEYEAVKNLNIITISHLGNEYDINIKGITKVEGNVSVRIESWFRKRNVKYDPCIVVIENGHIMIKAG